jgi:TldD protein
MKELLERIRDRANTLGVQFMDARLAEGDSTSVRVQDGKADEISQMSVSAVGIRTLVDDAWGFASTDVLTYESLEQSLVNAIDMARSSASRVLDPGAVCALEPVVDTVRTEVEIEASGIPLDEKIRRAVDYEAAGLKVGGDVISNSNVVLSDSQGREIVCNTQGTLIDQEKKRTAAIAFYTASDDSTRQQAFEAKVAQRGYELIEETSAEDLSELAARKAAALLNAERCPSGKFTVVLDPSVAGVFAHEVLGHNAEGDFVFAGTSIIEGRVGQQIGSEHVTIVNDATIPYVNGSYTYDSEGVPGGRIPIIERGILTGYLHSLESAARLGSVANGCGRAQDGHSIPQARMSNTFFVPGDTTLEAMIADIDEGILIEDSNSGYVYPERGTYTVRANQGRIIKNGQLGEAIREITFTGVLLETLQSVDGVSDGLELTPGMCGKGGQSVSVTSGGPYVRIQDVVVGGQT